jgi:S-adenosylmethionine:tRNA-ribosyltransferase-isomerase (queuine synthetase)
LFMLVSALMGWKECKLFTGTQSRKAIDLYSYGDSSLLLPEG